MNIVYAFAGGTIVGRFLGIIPSLMGVGMMVYVINPDIYNSTNLSQGYEIVQDLIKNFIFKNK